VHSDDSFFINLLCGHESIINGVMFETVLEEKTKEQLKSMSRTPSLNLMLIPKYTKNFDLIYFFLLLLLCNYKYL